MYRSYVWICSAVMISFTQMASWTAVAIMLIMSTVAAVVVIRHVVKVMTQGGIQFSKFQDTHVETDI